MLCLERSRRRARSALAYESAGERCRFDALRCQRRGAGLRERVDKDTAQRGVLWAARSIQNPRDDARTAPRWSSSLTRCFDWHWRARRCVGSGRAPHSDPRRLRPSVWDVKKSTPAAEHDERNAQQQPRASNQELRPSLAGPLRASTGVVSTQVRLVIG